MKEKQDNNIINIIMIIMLVIVLLIIIGIGYYKIREKQKVKSNTNELNNNVTINNNQNNINNNTENKTENNNDQKGEQDSDKENEIATSLIVTKTVSPKGFSGASNYNLCLYSDKTVYLITYNGEGYTEKDISSKQLLSENVDDIYFDENQEVICIVGGNKVNDSGMRWIEYK